MAIPADVEPTRILSVTEAAARGVAGLVKDAERGEEIVVERHGRPVAAVVSLEQLDAIREARRDVTAAALVLARELADDGRRTELDAVFSRLGFDRGELEAEVDADLVAGRE